MVSPAQFQVPGVPGGQVPVALGLFDSHQICGGQPDAALVAGTVDGGAVWGVRSFVYIRPFGISAYVLNESCVRKALEDLKAHRRVLQTIISPAHSDLEVSIDRLFLKQRQRVIRLFAKIRLAKIFILHPKGNEDFIGPQRSEEVQNAANDPSASAAYSPGSHSNPDGRGDLDEMSLGSHASEDADDWGNPSHDEVEDDLEEERRW